MRARETRGAAMMRHDPPPPPPPPRPTAPEARARRRRRRRRGRRRCRRRRRRRRRRRCHRHRRRCRCRRRVVVSSLLAAPPPQRFPRKEHSRHFAFFSRKRVDVLLAGLWRVDVLFARSPLLGGKRAGTGFRRKKSEHLWRESVP